MAITIEDIFGIIFFDLIVCRCLEGVLQLHKEIKEDEYLVPYAIVEIALLYIDEGRIDNAIAALEDAKYDFDLKFVFVRLFSS